MSFKYVYSIYIYIHTFIFFCLEKYVLIAKAAEPPAEGQQPQKASIGEIVWYPSYMYRFESGLSYLGCMIDRKTSSLILYGATDLS